MTDYYGTAGDDAIVVGNDSDASIFGYDGNDTLEGGGGNDVLEGGTGDDVLVAGLGVNSLFGGDGHDIYVVLSTLDVIVEALDAGWDQVMCAAPDFVLGANLEVLTLLAGGLTGSGNDLDNVLIGNDAGNTLRGGPGNDFLDGTSGDDQLYGEAGNDYLTGGDGQDQLDGGVDDDWLDGGAGADVLIGGLGGDTLVLDNVDDVVVEDASGGYDWILTTLDGYVLGANLEGLVLQGSAVVGSGNVADNALSGNELHNTLSGLDGDDYLSGQDGDDDLHGDGGADTLIGGAGADTLTGGAGSDSFTFNALPWNAESGDTITDFVAGQDQILLWILQEPTFIGDAGFSGAGPEIRAMDDGVNSTVELDLDGDATADMTITVLGTPSITAGDFAFLLP